MASSTPNAPDEINRPVNKAEQSDDDDDEEEVVDTGPDPEEVAARAKKIRRLLSRSIAAIEKHGTADKRTDKIRTELADQLMELKLAPKLTDALVRHLRDFVAVIRTQERQVMQICVRDSGMPRKDFIASFPKSETNLEWIDKHIRAKRKHSSAIAKRKDDILRAQRKLGCHRNADESQDRRNQRDQSPDVHWRSESPAREEGNGRGPTCDSLFLSPRSTRTADCNSWT